MGPSCVPLIASFTRICSGLRSAFSAESAPEAEVGEGWGCVFGYALVADLMTVTTTCKTTRWLSNDILMVTGHRRRSTPESLAKLSADNVHYVKSNPRCFPRTRLAVCLPSVSFANESELLPACLSHLRVSAIQVEPSRGLPGRRETMASACSLPICPLPPAPRKAG